MPIGHERGCSESFVPSISGHDYIVASWGSNTFYSFSLAEKVWMLLGLTPKGLGNEEQRLVYDDMALPAFGVAQGELSTHYHFGLQRNVRWTMANEYLRRYLWLRGARGVRIVNYEAMLADHPDLRALLQGQTHQVFKPPRGPAWYDLTIREHKDGLLLQLLAAVEVITPVECPSQSADDLRWPGLPKPVTHVSANAMRDEAVYLDDRFLERYEQNAFYEARPVGYFGTWYCSPSYRGQWSFTECKRVGRNFIRVPMRKIYEAKPDSEIVHAHAYAVDQAKVAATDLTEEHIAAKTQRLLDAVLQLTDALSALGKVVGRPPPAKGLLDISRDELKANGWMAYPVLSKLAQVAPLDMTQQAFLARCKSVHEFWQRIPNGYLKELLVAAGCPKADVAPLGSLRLVQALFNVVSELNAQLEKAEAFASSIEPPLWKQPSAMMAPLFLTNDLRIADAHEAINKLPDALRKMGFDTASLNAGYGRALDFVLDGVIGALDMVGKAIKELAQRR